MHIESRPLVLVTNRIHDVWMVQQMLDPQEQIYQRGAWCAVTQMKVGLAGEEHVLKSPKFVGYSQQWEVWAVPHALLSDNRDPITQAKHRVHWMLEQRLDLPQVAHGVVVGFGTNGFGGDKLLGKPIEREDFPKRAWKTQGFGSQIVQRYMRNYFRQVVKSGETYTKVTGIWGVDALRQVRGKSGMVTIQAQIPETHISNGGWSMWDPEVVGGGIFQQILFTNGQNRKNVPLMFALQGMPWPTALEVARGTRDQTGGGFFVNYTHSD